LRLDNLRIKAVAVAAFCSLGLAFAPVTGHGQSSAPPAPD
jgi:hypothetical protein